MSNTGTLKVYNNGNYIDTLVQKRKQGFIPYETNSPIREYNEFKSRLKPVIRLNDFEFILLNSRLKCFNSENKVCYKSFQEELIDYAEQDVFLLSLDVIEPIKYYHIPQREDKMATLRAHGEMLIGDNIITVSIALSRFSNTDPEFDELALLRQGFQDTQGYVNKGYWVPITLPTRRDLEESCTHFSKY